MNAIAIGPLVLAADRFAAIAGIFAFLIAASLFARRFDAVAGRWSGVALLAGVVAARAGHVGLNWESFSQEPWRMLALWQGGFQPLAGLVGVIVSALFFLRSIRSGVAMGLSLTIGLFVWSLVFQLTQATMGQPAPQFALQRLDGTSVSLADTGGRPAVINVWATWCPPCRREMPLLADAAERRGGEVAFFFVNLAEGEERIRSYLDGEGLRLENVLLDPGMAVPRHYNTIGVPVTLFLKPDGALSAIYTGEISPEALDANIRRVLR